MATLEQIEEGIRRAHAAGDAENVKKLGEAYRQMQARAGEAMDGVTVPPVPSGAPQAVPASEQPPALGGDAGRGFTHGLMQGMTFGFNDEIQGTLMSPIEMAIDAVQGKPFDPGRSWNQAVEKNRQGDAAAAEAAPIANMVGNIAGGVGTGIGLAKGGVTLMAGAKPTIASMGTRGAVEGAVYGGLNGLGTGTDDKLGSAMEGAAWGAGTGGFLGVLGGMIASKSAQGAAPTVEQLKQEAGALYDAARASGVVAPQQATTALNQTMKGIATAEGLITPAGRVNASYPRIQGVLNTFDDFSAGTMDIAQAQAVRKVLSDAAKSTEPGERRIATMMLEQFDSFLDPLAPQIGVANQIYSRAKKGELIEQAIELAGSRAGQFSGSCFENALRTEFRGLERQIIKGQLRGLTQPEIDAITKVAQGGPVENALRFVGKLAPTGVVSMGAGFGVPFAVGNAVGGPAVGAAAGLGTMGAGLAARGAATKMTASNAQKAVMEALLSGQARPQANQAIAPVVQALIAAQGTQAPQMNTNVARMLALN
jgi:hypothetical protein